MTFNQNAPIKPEYNAFVLYRTLVTAVSFAVFLSMVYFGVNYFKKIPLFYLLAPLAAVVFLRYISLKVRYDKEEYRLFQDRILQKGGGILSSCERELSVRNITHVTVIRPFILDKLFGTGYIKIESAGAVSTEIFLDCISRLDTVYTEIIALMKNNGFQLKQFNLVQQEVPHSLAVFFEVFQFFAMSIFVMFAVANGALEDSPEAVKFVLANIKIFAGIAGAVIGLILLASWYRFMDLKKRVYALYEDAIVSSGGFLSTTYSIIPMENLADSAVTQSFISKLFSLYDIKLSCQGSGQEILFKNIVNGEVLSNNIDKTISEFTSNVQMSEPAVEPHRVVYEKAAGISPARRVLEPDRELTGTFKMDPARTWMPFKLLSPLMIIIFPAGIIAAISNSIAVAHNTYKVKKDSIEHTFDFMSRKTKEFSFDKITSVIFKTSFIDNWTKTCSVFFWSIGSGENITFLNLRTENGLKEKILAKKGIRPQDKLYTVNSNFNIGEMIRGNFYAVTLMLAIAAAGTLFLPVLKAAPAVTAALILIISSAYRSIYYKCCAMDFYEDYVCCRKGWIFKEEYYALYDDIKDITTVKYFLSNKGKIVFNVAGETVVETRQGQHITSNSFEVRYVDDINIKDELVDTIFYRRPSSAQINEIQAELKDTSHEAVYSAQPALQNSLISTIITLAILDAAVFGAVYAMSLKIPYFLIIPVSAANILVLIILISVVRATAYKIQDYRVYMRSGILFKKQLSVIFDKIDFVNAEQGPLNKMFGNGNITVNTAGSRKPEMVIKNVPDHKKFYEILQAHYK